MAGGIVHKPWGVLIHERVRDAITRTVAARTCPGEPLSRHTRKNRLSRRHSYSPYGNTVQFTGSRISSYICDASARRVDQFSWVFDAFAMLKDEQITPSLFLSA